MSITRGAGLQRTHAAFLLAPIAILSVVVIGLTGNAYQTLFDPVQVLGENNVSQFLMGYTGPAATLAIAAVIAGTWYAIGKAESWVTAASALASALVAWAFGLVAFGFACKQSNVGNNGGEYDLAGGLKSLAGVTIVLFLLESVYVTLLHLVIAGTANSNS